MTNDLMTIYKSIGLMSGTSLDGVDVAFCEFKLENNKWHFHILTAETYTYSETWRSRLSLLEKGTALDFAITDMEYGHLLGQLCKTFIDKYNAKPDFIASHGHTIFHQPLKHLTSQIGHGSAIVAGSGFPVVCDFRTLDVASGGQGAPLVPIGDRYLFSDYDFCLNLGGFANISYEKDGLRIAFDICPVNIVLNSLAEKNGLRYDKDGLISKSGAVNPALLDDINSLDYYSRIPPKSLAKEWVVEKIFPLLSSSGLSLQDQLATFTEHIALQINRVTVGDKSKKILLTGGGAFNKFLIHNLRDYCIPEIVIPDDLTINFKEALIFAFLGVLRWRNEVNCLSSTTGATRDNSGGCIYLPGC